MEVPQRLLLATDLSCRCDRALDRAGLLAAEWRARLMVVHAMPAEAVSNADRDVPVPEWRRIDPRILAERRVRADVGDVAPAPAVVIGTGEPIDVILDAVSANDCDLIVTGLARDEPLGRLVLGSTVDKLMRRSPVPLLIVRRRARGPYRRIAVATDFSQPSREALEAAMGAFPQARFDLVHAYEAPMSGLVSDQNAHRAEFRAMAHGDAAAFLASYETAFPQRARPRLVLRHGDPDRELSAYADEEDIELVVMSTQNRSALMDAIIGSVAAELIRVVPCDVLVMRGEPRWGAGTS
ncbi:MAG TPA: universal stress protein [Hyphomicrobium sp.]|nr:universal stress protein [Hyphomicrobium sp.]